MHALKIRALANYLHIDEKQIRADSDSIFYANPETEYEDVYYVLTFDEANKFTEEYGLNNRQELASYDNRESTEFVEDRKFYIYRVD